jgi:LysR family hydrogen peroxide-inducible transcriptional activator
MAATTVPFEPQATNIQLLRDVIAVADTGSFRQAAALCLVTQPSLSTAVAQWERRMGCQLFERSRRRVRLTAIGLQLVEAGRKILADLERLEAGVAHAQPPFFGPVRVGIIPTLAPYILPPLNEAVVATYPGLPMPIVEGLTPHLFESLASGDLDALLARVEPMPAGLEMQPLFEDVFVAAVPAEHALALSETVSIEQLTEERLLLLDEGHCLRDQALAVCGLVSPRSKGLSYRATSLETLRHLVAAGHGVTLMPLSATHADHVCVSYVPLKEQTSRSIVLAWRSGDHREEGFVDLADLLT